MLDHIKTLDNNEHNEAVIIDTTATPIVSDNQSIAISAIDDTVFKNARTTVNKKYQMIKDDIARVGINQSLTVNQIDNGQYVLLAGFTRFAIAKELGLSHVPCIIKHLSDSDALKVHLGENLLRDDLSFADEARAAQRLMAHTCGDPKEAALQLGWTDKKFADRLQLAKCAENVLIALDKNEIQLRMAIVLSGFVEKIQLGTLKKIIDEKWDFNKLLERANMAKRSLNKACFDTKDCANCQHNTIKQADMFETGIDADAMCSNLVCYKTKRDEWLETKKQALIKDHGTVIVLSSVNQADRNDVSESIVGAKQYGSCVTCEHHATLMDDREGSEGFVIDAQCTNVTCFKKCVSKHKKSQQPSKPKATDKTANTKTHQPSDSSTQAAKRNAEEATPKEEKTVVEKPMKAVIEHAQKRIAMATFEHLRTKDNFALAFTLATLCDSIRVYPENTEKTRSVGQLLNTFLSMSNEELIAQMTCMSYEHLSSNTGLKGDHNSPVQILLNAHSALPEKESITKAAFVADSDTLNKYTIGAIVMMCQKSGFTFAYDKDPENHSAKATFAKLSKQGKPKLIKGIVDFEYDWSAFTPDFTLTI